jgi:hypothetical protein
VVHGRRWRRPLRRTPGCGNVSTNVYHQFEGREAGLAPIKSLWAAMTIFCFHVSPNHHPDLTQDGRNRIEYGNVYVLIKDRAVFAVKGASMSRPGPIDRRFANSRRIVENLAPRAARFTPHE